MPTISEPPFFEPLRARVVERLEALLGPPGANGRLGDAMRYSALGGGKRIRPILVYASAAALGVERSAVDCAACAVELIHCYSLVHDDLPAMDDDELRHGQPTVHKAFDDATAILAGDALQSLAFQVIGDDARLDGAVRARMVSTLAAAAGWVGMAGGQMIDMELSDQTASANLELVETMHRKKTGALLSSCVQLAACCAATDGGHLAKYANHLGIAFQIKDDILDVEGTEATTGKSSSDVALAKTTYVSQLGLDGAKRALREQYDACTASLLPLGDRAEDLQGLAQFVVQRTA